MKAKAVSFLMLKYKDRVLSWCLLSLQNNCYSKKRTICVPKLKINKKKKKIPPKTHTKNTQENRINF